MSNQPQPRPWFRLATLARASQPQTPPPTTTQPQTQAPVGPLLRAPTFRPAFRPTAPSQPQPPPPRATIPPPPSAPTPPRLPVLTPYARPAAATLPSVPASPKPSSPRTASPASPVVPPSKVTSPTPSKTLQNSTPPPSPPVLKTSPVIATKPEVPSSFPSPPTPKIESPVIATKREVPSSFPSPPKPKTEPPPSSKPSSPLPKTSNGVAPSSSLKASPVSVAARLPTPVASPTAAANHPLPETPKQSPVTSKPTPAAPPSPFSLPPSQTQLGASDGERESRIIPPEAEKKTVVQETTVPKQKPKNGAHTKPKGRDVFWKSSDDEEGGLRVITIAGENRGAVMELGYSPRRRGGGIVVHKVVKSEEADQLSGDEVRSKMEAQNGKTKPGLPMNAIMNSNVQGVNSSILLNSKCFHHDPGVHFSLTRKPFNGHLQAQGKGNLHHGNGRNNSQNRENGKWFSN